VAEVNNNKQPRRGRKAESSNVRLRPVFREEPDIEKLGRAIMAMAVSAADLAGQRQQINTVKILSDPTIDSLSNRSYDRGHHIEEEVSHE